uniref:Uncharacterized protein n=3 Tax=Lotharella oceanica TaxID=641309 RepID=A0A7S2XGH4_9EUKA|mmetsp:Transcript_5312/g.10563  ORF Transcript_5312/g.10563 Transcript_5312/m.10563 type:complete len:211 (+) Transcript_5312:299-931(+)
MLVSFMMVFIEYEYVHLLWSLQDLYANKFSGHIGLSSRSFRRSHRKNNSNSKSHHKKDNSKSINESKHEKNKLVNPESFPTIQSLNHEEVATAGDDGTEDNGGNGEEENKPRKLRKKERAQLKRAKGMIHKLNIYVWTIGIVALFVIAALFTFGIIAATTNHKYSEDTRDFSTSYDFASDLGEWVFIVVYGYYAYYNYVPLKFSCGDETN